MRKANHMDSGLDWGIIEKVDNKRSNLCSAIELLCLPMLRTGQTIITNTGTMLSSQVLDFASVIPEVAAEEPTKAATKT